MLYFPFRNENDLLADQRNSYIEKLNEPGVLQIINRNRAVIKLFSGIVEEALLRYRNGVLTNFNGYEQQENEEVNLEQENSEQLNFVEDETENHSVFEPDTNGNISAISIESLSFDI